MMEDRATYQTNRQRHELPPGTLLEYSDPRYQKPTGDDVRELLSRADLSGSQAAKLVGAGSSRTVRKWVGDESPIGYAAWRLILIYAGIVEPQRMSDSAAGIAAERK